MAILVTGTLFGFAHFKHPEVTFVLMPYYLAAAAIWAYATLARVVRKAPAITSAFRHDPPPSGRH